MGYSPRNEETRAILLGTPGARRCPHPKCEVITQGGLPGLDEHARVVHGSAK